MAGLRAGNKGTQEQGNTRTGEQTGPVFFRSSVPRVGSYTALRDWLLWLLFFAALALRLGFALLPLHDRPQPGAGQWH